MVERKGKGRGDLRTGKSGFALGTALVCSALWPWIPSCFADSGEMESQFSYSGFKIFGQVAFYLILIIGIFFLIVKVISQKNKTYLSARSVKSIGGVPLGQNKSVQVVEIGSHLFVLGVGNDVQLLGKIEDPEEIAYIKENIHARVTADFAKLGSLGKWVKSLRSKPDEEEELSASFQHVFQQKMQGVTGRKKQIDDLIGEQNLDDRLNDK